MNNEEFETKVQAFADMVLRERIAQLHRDGYHVTANNTIVQVKPGRDFVKVDVGPQGNISGKFMVERATGRIYGIKGYGVVHRGKFYDTLADTDTYNWGGYSPSKSPVNSLC